MGASRRPVFPAPSVSRRDIELEKLGRHAPRERELTSSHSSCPPPGPALGRPDDRLLRASSTPRPLGSRTAASGIPDRPLPSTPRLRRGRKQGRAEALAEAGEAGDDDGENGAQHQALMEKTRNVLIRSSSCGTGSARLAALLLWSIMSRRLISRHEVASCVDTACYRPHPVEKIACPDRVVVRYAVAVAFRSEDCGKRYRALLRGDR